VKGILIFCVLGSLNVRITARVCLAVLVFENHDVIVYDKLNNFFIVHYIAVCDDLNILLAN
jgi:hypothetical protein